MSKKKIILVEDDPAVQDSVKIILERSGFGVKIYPDGDPLLGGVYELPDLFILDKQLAGVDGIDVCSFLKKQGHTKKIPVIMLSASPHITKIAQAAGADDALEKPF